MNDFQKLVTWIDCGKLSVHEAQLVGGITFKIAGASNAAAAKYATFTIVPGNSIEVRKRPDFMQEVRDAFAMIPTEHGKDRPFRVNDMASTHQKMVVQVSREYPDYMDIFQAMARQPAHEVGHRK